MPHSSPTRVLTVDALHPDPAAIREAAALLRAGKLVAFPTETVYGLGANALDAQAVARIFTAKGRPSSDPLIVHLASPTDLPQVVAIVPLLAWQLAGHFWPGPLTLVLPRGPAVPALVSAGRTTLAVRVPRHPVALALIAAAGVPVAAPSANLFTRPSPTQAQHVLDDLDGRIELLLDAGPVEVGLESTVLDITVEPPVVLRPGGVTLEALQAVLPGVQFAPRYLAIEQAGAVASELPAAPGMLLRHYAPRAELRVFSGPTAVVLAQMQAQVAELLAHGRRVGLIVADEELHLFTGRGAVIEALGSSAAPAAMASRLFAALRALDAAGVEVILARMFGQAGVGLALWDRLYRAAEGRLVEVAGDDP